MQSYTEVGRFNMMDAIKTKIKMKIASNIPLRRSKNSNNISNRLDSLFIQETNFDDLEE